jgi:hypothetical protein
MFPAFRDLLAWLFGWKSAAVVLGPCGVAAGEVFMTGRQAGQLQCAGSVAGEVFTPGPRAGQIYG